MLGTLTCICLNWDDWSGCGFVLSKFLQLFESIPSAGKHRSKTLGAKQHSHTNILNLIQITLLFKKYSQILPSHLTKQSHI